MKAFVVLLLVFCFLPSLADAQQGIRQNNNAFEERDYDETARPLQQRQQQQYDNQRRLVLDLLFGVKSWLKSFLKGLFYRWKVPELYRTIPKPPEHTQAVVIGSGFGGSIAALRLAQAGIQVTVLERGQDWPIDNWRDIHTYEPLRDGRGVWHQTKLRTPIIAENGPVLPVDYFGGMVDSNDYKNISAFRAACVGGGSKVYTGVMLQPKREYFEQIFGDTVSFDEMDTIYYPRVREMFKVSPIPDDILQSKPFGHSRVWDEQVTNAGYTLERPDGIWNWDIVRDELEGRSKPSATKGMSNMGNSNGAKFDVTQNYLKDAIDTGLVRVYPNQQVTDIRETTSSGYSISIDKLSPDGRVVDQYTITCDHLFLAAGSIGTSELLVKAQAKGFIRNLNDKIGQGFGSNGDTLISRSFNPIRGAVQASPCSSSIHDADGPAPTTLEAWYIPGLPIDLGVQGTLGITLDLVNRGFFRYNADNDSVDLEFPQAGLDLPVESARRINTRIAQADPPSILGAAPFAPDVWAGLTAHPLGGAVIGQATDTIGRVRDGLYVVDGALIPGSTGAVNPALTISALAERCMERILAEDF